LNIAERTSASIETSIKYDFATALEAQEYARNNPGTVISRAKLGVGYDIVVTWYDQ